MADTPNDAPPGTSRKSDETKAIAEAQGWNNAKLIARTVTIDRPKDEIYAFWRDFKNLAAFLENIERVDVRSGALTHWVLTGPGGSKVEWDSEITEDTRGEVIAWRSVGSADVNNSGRVEFRDAPPGRGTQVSAVIAYEAPGGDLGKLIAKLFGTDPTVQAHRDLRRLKQLLETGEISTSQPPNAAPRAS